MAKAAVVEKTERKASESKKFRAYVILEDAIADKALRLQVIAKLQEANLL
jgi:hypothetical protein